MAYSVRWTIDVDDLPVMTEFWSEALEYEVAAVDELSARLSPSAALGASMDLLLQISDRLGQPQS
jgi:hypothetical protein